jgi:hypothetical protein
LARYGGTSVGEEGLLFTLLFRSKEEKSSAMRYNTGIQEAWFVESGVLVEVLPHVVPEQDCINNEVAMAGSAPLAFLQEQHGIGPIWSANAELDYKLEDQERTRRKENRHPGDYDIFVCGPNGRTEGAFKQYVGEVCKRLDCIGWKVISRSTYKHNYAREGVPIVVIDLDLNRISCKLSFVQCPTCDKIQEAVEGFDIHACRVIYHLHDGRLECKKEVFEQIRSNIGHVDVIKFGTEGPSFGDCTRMFRTMMRVRKYKDRGFRFPNFTGVRFDVDIERKLDNVVGERVQDRVDVEYLT